MNCETSIPPSRDGCCPGCGGNQVKAIKERGLSLTETFHDNVFVQQEYGIQRCLMCGLVFKDSILSQTDFTRYYDSIDFKRWEPPRPFPTERFVLDFLRSLPEQSSFLDFGCSTGRLLSNVVAKYACFGYEINQSAADEASDKGLTMFDSIAKLRDHRPGFDAILLIDVFEHLDNPTETLGLLTDLIKPGGFLILVTGNANCWACETDLPNFWYFRNIQHLCMITRNYAESLAKTFKIRVHVWKELSHYDTTLWQKAIQMLRHVTYSAMKRWAIATRYPVITIVPILKNAAKWKVPPPYSASKDHAVVIFVKS